MNFQKYKPYLTKGALIFSSFCIGMHYGPELKDLYSHTKDSLFGEKNMNPSIENAELLVRYVYL